MMKSTYGTGCFALLNTGTRWCTSRNRLLTTIAYQLDGKRTYALEGSIFIAGAAVQWLRDGLKLIATAPEADTLAARADEAEQIYLVPAFTSASVPHGGTRQARGAIFGLTRGSGAAELARAALEAVGFQTRDLLNAMRVDWPAAGAETVLRVDGGMTASVPAMQFLADILAMRRWTGRRTWKRPRWALPIWRAARRASAPISTALLAGYGSTADSNPAWMLAFASVNMPAGRTPCGAR